MINGLPNEVLARSPKANWSLLGQCHQVMVNVPRSMTHIEFPEPWGGRGSRSCLRRLRRPLLGEGTRRSPEGPGIYVRSDGEQRQEEAGY